MAIIIALTMCMLMFFNVLSTAQCTGNELCFRLQPSLGNCHDIEYVVTLLGPLSLVDTNL